MKLKIVRLVVAFLLSLVSTAIMSYISMATPIGPWIDTTLVLCSMLVFAVVGRSLTQAAYTSCVGLPTIAGGIGGIMATGAGFSVPTLYFVDRVLFDSWLQKPFYFAAIISSLSFVAGAFGLLVAQVFQEYLLVNQKLPFPIGELIYKTIAAQRSMRKSFELIIGFISTVVGLYVRQCTDSINDVIILSNQHVFSLITFPQIVLPIEK